MKFTPDQQKAIDLRNRNILVSAAAGSGKTAVLVERILGLLLDETHPVDIDRLLIVTFTNAAASEMRERIGAAIERRLALEPENRHLQRQATLLHHAQITTIDSFCLFVIRNNFNEIGLDPGFRVADSGEIQLLKQDIINEIFEELLDNEETREGFKGLLETIAYKGREKSLEEVILQINSFADSFPWPREWLEDRLQDYTSFGEDAQKAPWEQQLELLVSQELKEMKETLLQGLALCREADGPYMYEEALAADLDRIELLAARGWEEQYGELEQLTFQRLSAKKDDRVSPQKREMVKNLRDEVKDELGRLKKRYFSFSGQTVKEHMEEIAGREKVLIETVLLFRERFALKKREKNLLDFGDMEHFALDILTVREKNEKGEYTWKPSKTALDYRSYFYEIMIDEYQDSNLVQEYLLQSISGELEERHNRFMVGDLKQSIYKFRLARPEIFLEKYTTYGEEESKTQRVDLHQNFRSRKEVIDSVNHVFDQIMREDLGKIEYTHKEALYAGAVYPDTGDDYGTELLLLDKAEKKEPAREAAMVAVRIKQLVGKLQILDKETGCMRPAQYRDMVILFRSNAGWDEEFCQVLAQYGIPASVTSKTGYFSAKEVQIVLNFLRVIDNPRQDIPLYGVMKSLLGRFSEEEIVLIRSRKKGSLYDNLQAVAVGEAKADSRGEDEHLSQKAASLLETINRYRDMVYVIPIHRLLRLYLEETGYLYYFAGLPGGEQRTANVNMLLEKAETYEKTSYFGLFHFIRYMEQLQKYDVDAGEAGTVDENRDVVRLMSIHKSKGLEFPVCFVCGLSKQFNQMDARSALICDMDLGLGMEYRNPETRIRCADLRKNVIARKMTEDNLGEELRILYVAMTRAKEKLILTGMTEDYEKQALYYSVLNHVEEKKLPRRFLIRGTCFLDYLLAATARPDEAIRVVLWDAEEADKQVRGQEIKEEYSRLLLTRRLELMGGEEGETTRELKERLAFVYPHENLQGLYAKTTVSQLKMKAMEETDREAYNLFEEAEVVPYIPHFRQEKEEVAGTTRGNAYHRIMELTDFARLEDVEGLLADMEKWEEEGVLDASYRPLVNRDKLKHFVDSSLAKRMRTADEKHALFKEKPFVLGIPATILDQKFPPQEKVLIQGIVDAFFEEEGELVLVDYKTDRISTPGELVSRYQEQLKYYTMALEQLTGKRVKEKILYSFALNREIPVES